MQKLFSFTFIPRAEPDSEIDPALLGAWKDDTGAYLYFGKDGVMYSNQLGVNFSFYTYSAQDGKITQTYTMKEETTETATYKLNDDKLVYNNFEYQRISADELV